MPARTVVIEDLWKFQGERHEILTPGEYTQLTGRAGTARYRRAGSRGRGLPAPGAVRTRGRPRGDPDVRPQLVVPPVVQHGGQPGAQLRPRAGAPAAQLVVRAVPGRPRRGAAGTPTRARPGGARRLPRRTSPAIWATSTSTGACSWRRSASATTTAEGANGSGSSRYGRHVAGLRPGEVIHLPQARRRGLAVVLSSRDGKPTVLSEDRSYFRLSAKDFDDPPAVLTRIALPRSGSSRSARYRRDVASKLVSLHVKRPREPRHSGRPGGRAQGGGAGGAGGRPPVCVVSGACTRMCGGPRAPTRWPRR